MTNNATQTAPALTEQIIKQVVNAWATQNKGVTNFFAKYDDDVYLQEVAPGRNRAVYLLGHLISSNDGMITLFGLGDKVFPELYTTFSASPDKSVATIPTVSELKQQWEKITAVLTDHFNKMSTTDWLSRHTSVSEEDFSADPLRNKLNVLIGRTNHQSYHLGQLNLLTH